MKLPLIRDIKKAIVSFEDVCNRGASGYYGVEITNIKYSDTEFDENGDIGISFTGKLLFDDHTETWYDCHVRFLTLKKHL